MVVTRLARRLAVVLVVAALAAACGGGSTTAGTTTTTKAKDTGTTAALDAAAIFAAKDCQFLAEAMAANPLAAGAGSKTDWEAFAQTFKDLAKKAPKELKDDFTVFADAYVELGPALQALVTAQTSGKAPTAEQMQKLQELGSKLSEPRLQQAGTNISAYLSSHCSGSAAN